MHKTVNLCELWHRKFGHLHYGALPKLQNSVTRMPDILNDHMVFVEVGYLGKMLKVPFLEVTKDPRGS